MGTRADWRGDVQIERPRASHTLIPGLSTFLLRVSELFRVEPKSFENEMRYLGITMYNPSVLEEWP